MAEALRAGPVPLLEPYPGMAERERLHIAFAIPPFRHRLGRSQHHLPARPASRAHGSLVQRVAGRSAPRARRRTVPPALRGEIREHFAPIKAPLFKGFDHFYGADVVVATGWQTVPPVLRLEGCRARAYLINDHEPDFYAASVEAEWAEATYRLRPLRHRRQPVAARPLRRALRRLGRSCSSTAWTTPSTGRDRSRAATTPSCSTRGTGRPRRGVALGMLALARLHQRRPDLRDRPLRRHVPAPGGVPARARRRGQSRAALVAVLRGHRRDVALDDQLLARPAGDARVRPADRRPRPPEPALGLRAGRAGGARGLRRRRDRRRPRAAARRRGRAGAAVAAGLEFVRDHTWDAAAEQVERELRNALRMREPVPA